MNGLKTTSEYVNILNVRFRLKTCPEFKPNKISIHYKSIYIHIFSGDGGPPPLLPQYFPCYIIIKVHKDVIYIMDELFTEKVVSFRTVYL